MVHRGTVGQRNGTGPLGGSAQAGLGRSLGVSIVRMFVIVDGSVGCPLRQVRGTAGLKPAPTYRLGKPGRSFNPQAGEARTVVQPKAGEVGTVVQPTGWGSQDGRSTHRLGKPGRSFNPQAGEARTVVQPKAGEARAVVRPTGWGSQNGSFNPQAGEARTVVRPCSGQAGTSRTRARFKVQRAQGGLSRRHQKE